jgi:hypothetical protein
VEAALVDQLQTYVLGEQALAMVIGQVRAEIEAQLPQRNENIAVLEAELASVRAEQERLAKAVALSDKGPRAGRGVAATVGADPEPRSAGDRRQANSDRAGRPR